MAIFAKRERGARGVPGARWEPSERPAVPELLEAVGQAWLSGAGSVEACREAGRGLASMGAPLDEALDGLRTTSRQVLDRDPTYEEVRALSGGWADSTLGYLHRLDCADPMTGLASHAHLVARLTEVLAEPGEAPALLVVELPAASDAIHQAHLVGRVGDTVRTVVGRAPSVARLGGRRVVALLPRDHALADRAALVRRLVQHDQARARVWVEGLPTTGEAGLGPAIALLDELARG